VKVWVLGSGSRGNAVVVESDQCRVMIDAGFGPRIINKRMRAVGLRPESIEACVLTHEHSDHTRGATRSAKRWHWELWATQGTVEHSRRLRSAERPVKTFRAGATLSFSALDVQTFATPHDAAEPIGVLVTARRTGYRAAICTDLGHVTETVRTAVRDVDILVLESNHDEQMLWNGPYPPWLRARIASDVGHLSNRACADVVRDTVSTKLRQIVLAHISEQNNTPRVAFNNMRSAMKGTEFRGAMIPAAQDMVMGPFTPREFKGEGQLSLGL